MDSGAIPPLRVTKNNFLSPSKMPPTATSRPLAELNPLGIRRNSGGPSGNSQSPKTTPGRESSPFDPSPGSGSKLQMWKERENHSPTRGGNENAPFRDSAASSARRASLEHLKRASRVTANNIFVRGDEQVRDAQNGDTKVFVTRPLGTRKEPIGFSKNKIAEESKIQQNAFPSPRKNLQGETRIPWLSPDKMPAWSSKATSSPREQTSPQKTPLSVSSRSAALKALGIQETQTPHVDDLSAEDDHASTPRPVLRHPKSVSFDVAPPQINEYENITPDPSSIASGSREGSVEVDFEEDDYEYDQEQAYGDGDSFAESLEDAEKTPVVLPEDWRFMNPQVANKDLAKTFDDPFDADHSKIDTENHAKGTTSKQERILSRSDSVMSNGERRPLPPLPGGASPVTASWTFKNSISKSGAVPGRSLLAPYVTSGSRETSPTPLEHRMDSLTLKSEHSLSESMGTPSKGVKLDAVTESATEDEEAKPLPVDGTPADTKTYLNYQPPSHISRESILRKIQEKSYSSSSLYTGQGYGEDEFGEYDDDYDYADLDPDVPIRSCELTIANEEVTQLTISDIKEISSTMDRSTGPDQVAKLSENLACVAVEPEPAVENSIGNADITITRVPAQVQGVASSQTSAFNSESQLSGAGIVAASETRHQKSASSSHIGPGLGLPHFESFLGKTTFGLGLDSYLNVSQTFEVPEQKQHTHGAEEDAQAAQVVRPQTPTQTVSYTPTGSDIEASSERSETPDSVIHHAVDNETDEVEEHESPVIPEPVATIKSAGAKLKTRPSATPADIQAMAAARRVFSDDKPLPQLPACGSEEEDESDQEYEEHFHDHKEYLNDTTKSAGIDRFDMMLDLPLNTFAEGDGLGLHEALDRVVEAQKVEFDPNATHDFSKRTLDFLSYPRVEPCSHGKSTNIYTSTQRGYVTRQNPAVVVASNRQVSDDKSSVSSTQGEALQMPESYKRAPKSEPRKPSGNTWKSEPWNGRQRRQTSRRSSVMPEKRLNQGPVPPLPGQASVVTGGLDTLAEDQFQDQDAEDGERGRVFVKVVRIKELDLPLPQDERCHFTLTLDNGLHCVTTNLIELGRTAPIGQEFELVVFDDLEFQLTLSTHLKRPESIASIDSLNAHSSSSSFRLPKASKLTRLLASPKKRRERELREREEEAAHRQYEQDSLRAARRPTAYDLQHQIVAEDGNFARAYVSLNNFEQQAYGRPYNTDVPCFNEWAMEDKSIVSSTRSKLGGIQRRPPYRIGKLELQLLFVPKLQGVPDDDMPRSISAANRQMKEAEEVREHYFEGHLSQQGGDCPYWRRRFFKMKGLTLTAYHETTGQVRATISLARAVQLIDDQHTLTESDTPGPASNSPTKSTNRRKSAFARDEEGFMFVDEGFRIRFANGESIDFYADNAQDKEKWMRALSAVVGRDGASVRPTWMAAVLAKERAMARQGIRRDRVDEYNVPLRGGSRSAPTSPRKPVPAPAAAAQESYSSRMDLASTVGFMPPQKSAPTNQQKHSSMPNPSQQHQKSLTLSEKRMGRRQAVRSMIF